MGADTQFKLIMSFKIDDTNYPEYKRIFEILWIHQKKYFPPKFIRSNSPIDILNEFEKKSKSIAKRGLKAGLNDVISQLKYYPSDMLKDIETDLAKNGLPTTQILFSQYKTPKLKSKGGSLN